MRDLAEASVGISRLRINCLTVTNTLTDMRLLAFLALLPLALAIQNTKYTPKVETKLGGIVGHYKHSEHGRRYLAFEGIPYAQPPVGELRFQVCENFFRFIFLSSLYLFFYRFTFLIRGSGDLTLRKNDNVKLKKPIIKVIKII